MVKRNLARAIILLCALPSVASAQSWSDRADADLAVLAADARRDAVERMNQAARAMEDAYRAGDRQAADWARSDFDSARIDAGW